MAATYWRNLVPTFADRGVSLGQRGGSLMVVHLSFLVRSRYFSSSSSAFILTRAEWIPFQTHCYSQNLAASGIEPGTSGLVAKKYDHKTTEAVLVTYYLVYFSSLLCFPLDLPVIYLNVMLCRPLCSYLYLHCVESVIGFVAVGSAQRMNYYYHYVDNDQDIFLKTVSESMIIAYVSYSAPFCRQNLQGGSLG
jgi:hypothetical protein